MLFLAEVQLTFFTMASMGLCFAEKSVVYAEQHLHRARVFSAFHTAILPPMEVYRKFKKTQIGQLTSVGQRDISHHMMSNSVYKDRGRRQKCLEG